MSGEVLDSSRLGGLSARGLWNDRGMRFTEGMDPGSGAGMTEGAWGGEGGPKRLELVIAAHFGE